MQIKVKLAKRSSGNRMFYDNLIKEIAICINTGDMAMNRDLELPSYRGIQTRGGEDVVAIGDKNQAVGFDTPAQMLPTGTLDAIDAILMNAKTEGLTGCCSQRRIADFIMQHTDLEDCHLTAMNEMRSIQ